MELEEEPPMSEAASRELRLHRIALAGLAAALAVLLLLGGTGPRSPEELTVSRLTLVDGTGERVALLETADTGPRLVLFDRRARPRLEVAVQNDVPSVTLMQPDGRVRVGLTAEERGAGVAVLDGLGQPRGEIRVVDDHPELFLRDGKGKARVALGATGEAAGLLLYDDQTRPRASFTMEANRARLVLTDPAYANRLVLQSGAPGETGMQFLDPKGAVVWEAREPRTR